MLPILLLMAGSGLARGDSGLLLAAHGAPNPQWNQPVLELGGAVASLAASEGSFKAVRTAMLEYAQPDIPSAVKELEKAGCRRVVVVPLFIAPSDHTVLDLPEALDLEKSPEGFPSQAAWAKPSSSSLPLKITGALDEGTLLAEFALRQVKQLSRDPAREALVILAHGDPRHRKLLDRKMARIAAYCCGRTGIDDGDWAYIEMGQEYLSEGVAAVERGLKNKSSVIVVGLYLATSAEQLHRSVVARAMAQKKIESDPLAGKPVAFSSEGVVRHPGLSQYVLDAAVKALADRPAAAAAGNEGQTAAAEDRSAVK
ncbi:MAG: hypothetical protein IT426_09340 [Pirellulales bacterium]|nr:hypothetical protein [Pirellulales bacterium]